VKVQYQNRMNHTTYQIMVEQGKSMGAGLFFQSLFAVIMLLQIAVTTATESEASKLLIVLVGKQCQGEFKHKTLTPDVLKRVLTEHQAWYKDYLNNKVKFNDFDSRRANLCMADLNEINLSDANLMGANLSGAYLEKANLVGTNLIDADLRRARFDSANLTGAKLDSADLREAFLIKSNLSGTSFIAANMKGTIFNPRELPPGGFFAFAKNLQYMHYVFSPDALMRLRKNLRDAGLTNEERAVTYAIKRSELISQLSGHKGRTIYDIIEGSFKLLFFDLTTQWGMSPGRALLLLIYFIPIFAIPYVIVLRRPGENGIWCKWAEDRIRVDLGSKEPVLLQFGWLKAFIFGLYFSVLSAFNIGWRDLNVGNWIQRLQVREYILRPTGWVRTVSGVQALISVYLLAIWVLTYFGRPFG